MSNGATKQPSDVAQRHGLVEELNGYSVECSELGWVFVKNATSAGRIRFNEYSGALEQ